MPRDAQRTIRLYDRAGCHLCEDAREMLDAVLEERAAAGRPSVRVETIDIGSDPSLHRRYRDAIPVLAVGDRELPLALRTADIRAFLERSLDGAVA